MKRFVAGVLSVLLLLILMSISIARLGIVAVNADGNHSSLEARLMPLALQSSVARHAPDLTNPVQVTEDNLKSAAILYRANCSQCHGTPAGPTTLMGKSFYPPATQLGDGLHDYSESQIFWMIKHGIRNTGMPAWGDLLPDESIWQLVNLLKHQDDLPPSTKAQLKPGAKYKTE